MLDLAGQRVAMTRGLDGAGRQDDRFGPRDPVDPARCDVIPTPIGRFVVARQRQQDEVPVWVTRQATRVLPSPKDAAETIVLARRSDQPAPVDGGAGVAHPVRGRLQETGVPA